MKFDRRQALALLGLGTAGAAAPAGQAGLGWNFLHGVASGDPLQDRVVIWTRLTPQAPTAAAARVVWQVTDEETGKVAAGGDAEATAARDYTVKVDVTGLRPGRAYRYSFGAPAGMDGISSPVGRTRTLPAGPTKDVVLAVANCSLYPGGYFNAYEAIARLPRVDAVLHLGDYIYEYGPEGYGYETGKQLGRLPDPPHECITLDDYRRRHACHKSDPQLQAAHARAPWIVAWDDHETANDSYKDGAENHNPDKGEGDWAARKTAAIRAYYEWMPIREPAAGASPFAAWRSFDFGDLMKLVMTETRLTARTHQLTYDHDLPMADGKPNIAAFKARWNDPARRMMGPAQESWIGAELAASTRAGHAWQVIGGQVVMARLTAPDLRKAMTAEQWAALDGQLGEGGQRRIERLSRLGALGLPYNLDSWDGYPADRERLYDLFKKAGAHPIVLSGDSHVFWVNELWDGPGKTRVAAEFGATGITSPGAGDVLKGVPLAEAFAKTNREVIHTDQAAKGFVLLTLSREAARGELVTVSTIMDRTYEVKTRKTFGVRPAKGAGVEPVREV